MTDHAVPTPGPRTLADQIRHCAQRTAEPGNDGQRAGIAVTLQGIANQVQQIELRAATGETEVRDAIRRLLPHGGFDLAAMRGHGIPGVNANTRDGKDALVIRCRCMRRLEWPADEPLPMDILLCWLIDHDDEMFLTPRELEAKYAARLAAPPVALDPFGLPLAYDPLGALGLPPQAVQDGPQRHPAAPAAAETDAEPRQDICEPQEPARAATGYHANRRRQNPGGGFITTYYQATPNRLPEPPVAPTRLDGATTGRRPSRRALAEFAVFITLGLIPLLIALLAH